MPFVGAKVGEVGDLARARRRVARVKREAEEGLRGSRTSERSEVGMKVVVGSMGVGGGFRGRVPDTVLRLCKMLETVLRMFLYEGQVRLRDLVSASIASWRAWGSAGVGVMVVFFFISRRSRMSLAVSLSASASERRTMRMRWLVLLV